MSASPDIADFIRGVIDIDALQHAYKLSNEDIEKLFVLLGVIGRVADKMQ